MYGSEFRYLPMAPQFMRTMCIAVPHEMQLISERRIEAGTHTARRRLGESSAKNVTGNDEAL